jgi:hypothetical protein
MESFLDNRLGKHVPTTTDTHATIEVLKGVAVQRVLET